MNQREKGDLLKSLACRPPMGWNRPELFCSFLWSLTMCVYLVKRKMVLVMDSLALPCTLKGTDQNTQQ